jgi:hypothetical protein
MAQVLLDDTVNDIEGKAGDDKEDSGEDRDRTL